MSEKPLLTIRSPRRRKASRWSDTGPDGGWSAAELKLPVFWYHAIATASGAEYPVSGDRNAEVTP
ncbi:MULTISPECIES: hypothetical protein [Arthrobacter]|uniref:Uncharacterized protein n=1 Tax=Arthrobacter terricola TaxID=2547396 RepID=A0A4R5K669_9MICC|nr:MULTISPECIES: hypothetical protein [Arthrobacter]MBT8163081.1 hypothetical protein [Arthrobacter sp. GN70]TDF88121.1 hypothetical protein E1809_24180 [Arthrobacter terricola]